MSGALVALATGAPHMDEPRAVSSVRVGSDKVRQPGVRVSVWDSPTTYVERMLGVALADGHLASPEINHLSDHLLSCVPVKVRPRPRVGQVFFCDLYPQVNDASVTAWTGRIPSAV
ncbi:hypothetical protein DSY14_08850 [Nocardiopsis sp. MG754419]|nr:hypothetical protein [Nocardiopsis sp. MG754419]